MGAVCRVIVKMPAQIMPNNPVLAVGSISQADMDAAASRVQAAVRGRSVRRDWVDRQLAAIGEAPIDVPHARQSESDSYPLYCIPVSTFLGLDDWVPHQDALEQGLLVEYDAATMADRVLFISHQWTSWYHPDPKGDQLRALKFSIEKLLEGQTAVRSNPQLEMKFKWNINHTGEWWRQMLPKMFLWIDFFSMPQPLAARFKGMSKEQIEIRRREAPVGYGSRVAAAVKEGTCVSLYFSLLNYLFISFTSVFNLDVLLFLIRIHYTFVHR